MNQPLPRIHPKTGQECYISNGLPGSTQWATYIRKPNGSMKRIVSRHLPLRPTPLEALLDLEAWLDGGSRVGPKGAKR